MKVQPLLSAYQLIILSKFKKTVKRLCLYLKGIDFMKDYLLKNNRYISKKIILLSSMLLIGVLILSCRQNGDSDLDSDYEAQTKIYYLDSNQTSIVSMDYTPRESSTSGLIEELIWALGQNPKSSSMKKAKPDSILIQGYHLTKDGILTLDFNSEYMEFTGVEEILSRVTIVNTLSQVDGVDYIEFTINGQPIMLSNNKPLGLMEESDFIYNTNAENVYVTVYFSNEEGTALLPSNLKITYDGNIPIAELILNRILMGPLEDGMQLTVPKATELNSVTTKEGICYVDFNEEFLNKNPEMDAEIVVYSVVNSLVELSYINKVQFTINGAKIEDYNGLPFSGHFERKLELIDESS